MRTLAAIIPVFNQRHEIASTLAALDTAIRKSSFDAQIYVVDDGSSDGTADAARSWHGDTRVSVIQQENQGRFAARLHGIEAASSAYCLLIDSRVLIGEDALGFVESQLGDPESIVWNAHVEIETNGKPFGLFWDVITRRAFWTYFRAPKKTRFGLDDFELYPKGTTCFFAPRDLLLQAFDAFHSRYRDPRHANDDTPVIRWLAARTPINIAPEFWCRYAARERLRPFIRHAFHRGIVFVDGHGRRESRWFPIVAAFFPLTLLWLAASVYRPWALLAPIVLPAVGGVGLAVQQHRVRAGVVMAWVTPIYALAHGLGMWRGLLLAAQARLGAAA